MLLKLILRVTELQQRPKFDIFQKSLSLILTLYTNLVLNLVPVAAGQYLRVSISSIRNLSWKDHHTLVDICGDITHIATKHPSGQNRFACHFFSSDIRLYSIATIIKEKRNMANQIDKHSPVTMTFNLINFL